MLEARYRELLELAQQMRNAAKAGDWPSVCRFNDERSALISNLPKSMPPLDRDTGRSLETLIAATLDCDREVRNLAEAWMEDATPLLSVLAKIPGEKRVQPEVS